MILPSAGMAQDDSKALEKEEAAPAQPEATAADDTAEVKENAEASSTMYLDSMVITGTRTESKLKDLPASISVVGTRDIETVKFIDSRKELLRRIPGFSMIRNLRVPFGGKNYTINLVDGLATTSAFGSGSLGSPDKTNSFDIERIEVVKGPASALYGSHALGGVINVITRKPPQEPEYRISAEGGMYDRYRGGVSAGGSSGALGYFVDANMLDYEGWRDRSHIEKKQASGKLLFDIGTASTVTLRGEYIDHFEENPGYLKVSDASGEDFDDIDWKEAGVDDAFNDQQALSFSAKYERDLSNQSGFELAYGIRNTESEGPPSYSPTSGFGSSDVTNHNLVGIYNHGFDFYRSKVIAGIDLQHSSSDSTTYSERTVGSDIDQQWDIEAEVMSPFLQYEVSPLERVRLSLGARYDTITYSARGYKVSYSSGRTDYDESADFNNLSPKAGVTIDLGSEQSMWLSYGQGFVVPSLTYLFVGRGDYAANPDLDPEKANHYEIGFRGQLINAKLVYDITLFRTDIEDMLVADNNINRYVNAGEVRIQGVESAVGYAIHDQWRLDLAYTYADNEYIDFGSMVGYGPSAEYVEYNGNTLSASPEHHLNARLTWMPIRGLAAELEWNTISSYYTNAGNNDPNGKENRPDLFNLRLSYGTGPWKFWVHVLNLLDEKYAERVSYSSSTNERSYTSGEPLNAYAGLSYTF
jgi:outer membrane receptor protein involved in Fe transport